MDLHIESHTAWYVIWYVINAASRSHTARLLALPSRNFFFLGIVAGVDCARGTLRGGGVAGMDICAGVPGIVALFLLGELMLELGDIDPLGVAILVTRQTSWLKINSVSLKVY